MIRGLLFSTALIAVMACSETPATQTMVRFAAPSAMVARGASLTVRVLGVDGSPSYDVTREVTGEPALRFPASVPVVPADGDATATFTVEATLRDESGTIIGEQRARSGFVADALREVWLCFDPLCEGVTCDDGLRCVAGGCDSDALPAQELGVVDPEVLCTATPLDAGPDTDAGPDVGADAPTCSCPCASDTCDGDVCVPQAFTAVAAGDNHACAVDEAGNAFCWGANARGQLGVGDTAPRRVPTAIVTSGVTQIATGVNHSCAVLADGSIACWGSDDNGKSGQMDTADDLLVPTSVGSDLDWAQVDTGREHTCGLRSTGVFCWGSNSNGQLGIGIGTGGGERQLPAMVRSNFVFVATGHIHTCAIEDSSWALYCWGESSRGRIADAGADVSDQDRPYRSPNNPDHLMLSLGREHSMSVGRDGMLRGWGNNRNFQVGLGSWNEPPHQVEVTMDTDWTWVSAGGNHSCAIRAGVLTCFGSGDQGQLGDGDTSSGSEQVPVGDPGWTRVAAGGAFSCGIRDDGTLYCWGDNAFGQLGLGDVAQRLVPERVCHP